MTMLVNLVGTSCIRLFQIQFGKKHVLVDKEVRDPDRLE